MISNIADTLYVIQKVKDERTFLQKVFGYYPRYSMTITDGINKLVVNQGEIFTLEKWIKNNKKRRNK